MFCQFSRDFSFFPCQAATDRKELAINKLIRRKQNFSAIRRLHLYECHNSFFIGFINDFSILFRPKDGCFISSNEYWSKEIAVYFLL
jgi:hypothetical protein